MLAITDLVKRFGKFTAVDGLNMQIENGSIFGFVGPNGAGKTTTMKIMAGLLRMTSGNVEINGISVSTDPRMLRKKIGYMPDFFGVYDDLKVTEYMDFYAGTYYIPYKERPELVDSLLDIVNLSDKKNAYVDSLSRGMKQRLCLARAMIHDPEILILDEPASGLDPRARVEMKEVLKQLRTLGKTVIISSHILPELSEMCTQVGIIDHGKLVTQGSIEEIRRLLMNKRVLVIKPLSEKERLRKIVEEQPKAEEITENVDTVEFAFDGDDEEISKLLFTIVNQGVPIVDFHEKEGNLEEIFMQVTGGGTES